MNEIYDKLLVFPIQEAFVVSQLGVCINYLKAERYGAST